VKSLWNNLKKIYKNKKKEELKEEEQKKEEPRRESVSNKKVGASTSPTEVSVLEKTKPTLAIEVEEKSTQNREDEPPVLPRKNTIPGVPPTSPKATTTEKTKTRTATATIESDPIRTTMKTFSQLQEDAAKKKKKMMTVKNVKKKSIKKHSLIKLKNQLNN